MTKTYLFRNFFNHTTKIVSVKDTPIFMLTSPPHFQLMNNFREKSTMLINIF